MVYLDEDGDWVNFNSEEEFEEMKENAGEQVKIRVSEKEAERKSFNGFPHHHHHRRFPHHPFGFQFGGKLFHPLFGAFGRRGRRRNRRCQRNRMGHFGIVCDGCERRNWSGLRFKCQDCPFHPGFDLCGECMKDHKDKHDPTHRFKQIHLPHHHQRFPFERLFGVGKGCCGVSKNEKKVDDDVKEEEEEKKEENIQYPDENVDEESEGEEEKKEENSLLEFLRDMGFLDEEKNRKILEEFNGDIKKVVEKLISFGN